MHKLADLSVEDRMTKFVETYEWLRGAAQERILSRGNLGLKAVCPFANALTIVDISDPRMWRIRLSGTAACDRTGSDPTGKNALLSCAEGERDMLRQLVEGLFDGPRAVRARLCETYIGGQQAILDSVTLPLVGPRDERLVVHYAQIAEDIECDFGERPRAVVTGIEDWRYLALARPGEAARRDKRLSA